MAHLGQSLGALVAGLRTAGICHTDATSLPCCRVSRASLRRVQGSVSTSRVLAAPPNLFLKLGSRTKHTHTQKKSHFQYILGNAGDGVESQANVIFLWETLATSPRELSQP